MQGTEISTLQAFLQALFADAEGLVEYARPEKRPLVLPVH
jgi:hypothetical protein